MLEDDGSLNPIDDNFEENQPQKSFAIGMSQETNCDV